MLEDAQKQMEILMKFEFIKSIKFRKQKSKIKIDVDFGIYGKARGFITLLEVLEIAESYDLKK